ncbi:hypothetical protein JVU11DRAFT_7682 [Chiua virens]|nr:hypothetical protein JVU11DRAFT_7682 [Chiua virens]
MDTSMPGWTLLDTHPTQGRTFHRPMDPSETSFLWDGLLNGTADTVHAHELRLSNGSEDARLFSDVNIVKSWLSAKRRYPLTGAIIQGPSGMPFRKMTSKTADDDDCDRIAGFASQPHLAVREHDLTVIRPGEIVFERVTGAKEVENRIATFFDDARPFSEDLLTQLYVVCEVERTDVLYLIIRVAHLVTDGMANYTFVRCLLDMLGRCGESEPVQIPLEDRLAMAVPLAERIPIQLRSLSPARRRWRMALGSLILRSRMEKMKGGHTLPCSITRSTPFVPARSREMSIMLTPAETATVLANCRLHKVTFGNAYPVLTQMATTRLLYRRYLRGEISEEEWQHRKKEPYTISSPLNLRPYLDKAWFERGGGGEFVTSLSLSFYQLPCMPLGETARSSGQKLGLSDGAPPFSDLLTFDRFRYRVELIKKQAAALFDHPLFLEMVHAASMQRQLRAPSVVLQWLQRTKIAKDRTREDSDEEVLTIKDIPRTWGHAGSSFGDLASMLPLEYPLPPAHRLSPFSSVSHPSRAGYVAYPRPSEPSPQSSADSIPSGLDSPTPRIAIRNTWLHLNARPAELYLTAWSFGGRMKMFSCFDSNVYEEAVVKEWLAEIKGAMLWYLGRTHEPRRTRQSRSGKVGVEGIHTKL